MALSWTSALRETVALTVLQKAYSELRAIEKNVLDNQTTGDTPGGLAGHALTYVNQFAQWFSEATAGATTSPAAWETVLAAEACYRFALAVRKEDAREHGAQLARSWNSALDSYANVDAYAGGVQDATITLLMVRMFCIRRLVRLPKGRRYVPVATIDQCAKQAFEKMWHHAVWNFATRTVTITLPSATPTAPTMDLPSGEVFHSVVSPWLSFTSSTAIRGEPVKCVWGDSQRMSEALACTGVTAAAPEMFNFEIRSDGSRYWRWFPAPDQNYTFVAQVKVDNPTWPTSISDSAPFAKLPKPFQSIYPELAYAQVLRSTGLPGWQDAWQGAVDALDGLLDHVQSRGLPEAYATQAEDVYGDDFGVPTRL